MLQNTFGFLYEAERPSPDPQALGGQSRRPSKSSFLSQALVAWAAAIARGTEASVPVGPFGLAAALGHLHCKLPYTVLVAPLSTLGVGLFLAFLPSPHTRISLPFLKFLPSSLLVP